MSFSLYKKQRNHNIFYKYISFLDTIHMKSKNKNITFIIILLLIIVTSIILYTISNSNIQKENTNLDIPQITEIAEVDWDDVQNRIDTLKKRLSFKWLIQDWDIHFQNKEYTRALTKYIQVNKQNPTDQSIINKIWNIYFHLNKYSQSYKYFSQIKDYNQLNKHRALKALFYSEDIKWENIEKIKSEILTFELTKDEQFYYTNSLVCTVNYHDCRQNYQDYFDKIKVNPESGTWELLDTWIITFQELINIQEAITNYKNFQLDDLSYKAALISWAYFQNELYPIAIETSKDTLINSPDYRPLIKIIAKSYYEMGEYIDAKKFLIQYNGLWDNEPEISYFLGIVHQKLREDTRSTIQLRKSIQLGFTRDLDVKRRLLFNYYQLGDTDKMLWIFQEIIRDNINEVTVQDMSLAIFYHILNDKNDKATIFTTFALKKFPENEVFYWYHGWLILQEENISDENLLKAEEVLQKWLAINNKNPMISLTLWQLEEKRGNMQKAFIFYKQTVSLDKGWEYEKFAKQKLEILKLNK